MAEQMEVEMDKSKDSGDNVQTQLQENYLKSIVTLTEGEVVDGTVVSVTQDRVFVDVGSKSEGGISISEFTEIPKPGDVVTVQVVKLENNRGEVVLSKKRVDEKLTMKKLRQAYNNKQPVTGVIKKITNGGYEVDLGGDMTAFLPTSQADRVRVERPESLLNLSAEFLIERFNTNGGKSNIVVNRRKYLENNIKEARDAFFANTQIGDEVTGVVKSFTSFGAFVDLGGFDGLLHINDMSWGHVAKPKDFVKKGQTVKLKVIRLDPEEKRINLSLKHFTEDPWLHFQDDFAVNDIVKGKVTKITDFGAFIELKEGIEGLAHISEFSWVKKINKPEDMVKIGDIVDCAILGFDIRDGRVSLGLKQAHENPWDTIGDKYPVGTKISKKIVKFTNSGAFVELEDGIDAFLSADDVSWSRRTKPMNSEFAVGDTIDCVIIENDPEARRIRVGIKQLSDDPWVLFARDNEEGTEIEGEISSIKKDIGIFVKLAEGVEGLIYKTNLLENKEDNIEEALAKYNVGDKIKAVISDMNADKRKISLSVRDYKKRLKRNEISQYISSDNDDEQGKFTLGDLLKDKNN